MFKPMYLLVKEIEVTSDVSLIEIKELNGNRDKIYTIFFSYNNPLAQRAKILIHLNNDQADNYQSGEFYSAEKTGRTYHKNNGLELTGKPLPGRGVSQGMALINVISGKPRVLTAQWQEYHPEGYLTVISSSRWMNEEDNITSMIFRSNLPKGIGKGTWIVVSKYFWPSLSKHQTLLDS